MKDRKNLFIISLLAVVIVMGVGYAVLAQQLTINGTANITASWDVRITGITAKNLVGATVENGYPAYSVTDASFDVSLAYPGASASFDITVENNGTIDAILDSITGVTEANSNDPLYISYTVSGMSEGDRLNAGTAPQTLTVTVTWSAAETTVPSGTVTKAATIHLNYVQA